MAEDGIKMKVEFAPGCFDNFDGSQEELDVFIREITELAQSGELIESMIIMTEEDLDNLDPELAEQLLEMLQSPNENIPYQPKRTLN